MMLNLVGASIHEAKKQGVYEEATHSDAFSEVETRYYHQIARSIRSQGIWRGKIYWEQWWYKPSGLKIFSWANHTLFSCDLLPLLILMIHVIWAAIKKYKGHHKLCWLSRCAFSLRTSVAHVSDFWDFWELQCLSSESWVFHPAKGCVSWKNKKKNIIALIAANII